MTLTDAQKIAITRANVLVQVAPQVLSEFELETVREVSRRYAAFGAATASTVDEMAVVERAVAAMETALRTTFAQVGEALESGQLVLRRAA